MSQTDAMLLPNDTRTVTISSNRNSTKCAEVYRNESGMFDYICLLCTQSFQEPIELQTHLIDHFSKYLDDLSLTETAECKVEIKDEFISESPPQQHDYDDDFALNDSEDSNKDQATEAPSNIKLKSQTIKRKPDKKKPKKCRKCFRKTFKCQSLKDEHERQMHNIDKPYQCYVCPVKFDTEQDLRQHRDTHRQDNLIICPHCQTIFGNQTQLKEHLNVGQISKRKTDLQVFACNLCDKICTGKNNFSRHMDNHMDKREKQFICDICNASFRLKGNLRSHIRIHINERLYSCSICGKTFAHPSYVKIHLRFHSREKNYQCDECGKSFYTKGQLSLHGQRAHTIGSKYPCPQCDKRFKIKVQLKRHMAVHSTVKPYECDVCDSKFTTKRGLKNHSFIHSVVKQFPCRHCDARFPQPAGRRSHEKRIHGIRFS